MVALQFHFSLHSGRRQRRRRSYRQLRLVRQPPWQRSGKLKLAWLWLLRQRRLSENKPLLPSTPWSRQQKSRSMPSRYAAVLLLLCNPSTALLYRSAWQKLCLCIIIAFAILLCG